MANRCNHGMQISDQIYAFCLLASGHAGDHKYMDSRGFFTIDEASENDSDEPDVCPTCGTNLAAKRKERERRRAYMRNRRAKSQ